MVSKATTTQLKVVKAAAESKKPSLTAQLEAARKRNKELLAQYGLLEARQQALQELVDKAQAVVESPKPPTLLEYLATVDLSIFDEATATLIQRLQKRLTLL